MNLFSPLFFVLDVESQSVSPWGYQGYTSSTRASVRAFGLIPSHHTMVGCGSDNPEGLWPWKPTHVWMLLCLNMTPGEETEGKGTGQDCPGRHVTCRWCNGKVKSRRSRCFWCFVARKYGGREEEADRLYAGEIPRFTGCKAPASSVLQCHESRRSVTIKSRCQYGDSQLLLLLNNLLIISFYLSSARTFAD